MVSKFQLVLLLIFGALPLQAVDKMAMQRDYQIFEAKCSRCHNLQCSLAGPEVLPCEIQRMICRMAQMNGANISPDEQRQILDFMIYYTTERKKEALHCSLERLPDSERQKELSRINEALGKYQ